MISDPPPFDIYGELPSGTTVLEASAGTGKTYTVAALTARVIAEGAADLSQMLLVTFGRMATNELRLRVRERLVSVEDSLAAAVRHGRATPGRSAILKPSSAPATWTNYGVAAPEYHARLRTSMLQPLRLRMSSVCRCSTALGYLGDREPHATIVEHLTDLTREVTTDLYLRRYAASGTPTDELRRGAGRGESGGRGRARPAGAGWAGFGRSVGEQRAGEVRVSRTGRGGTPETRGQLCSPTTTC